MKMKLRLLLIIGFYILCSVNVLRGQNANSTAGGFMSQFNSWISRLRGHNHSNNNNNNSNNNSNNSDKSKESENAGAGGQQSQRPMQYNVMPYPMMTGMAGMYSPMSPMTMSFAPRPMPSTAFAPGMPFGSLAAGSSLGPNIGSLSMGAGLSAGMPSNMGASMGSPLSSGLSSGMGSTYAQLTQMRPSYSSASHMMPVHHDYPESGSEYQVNGYGVANSFPNSYNGGYPGLSNGGNEQINDNGYNGETEQNNAEEYSSGYQR